MSTTHPGKSSEWLPALPASGAHHAVAGRIDWEAFARDWRAGYGPAMDRVRRGEIAWANIDALHRLILDEILPTYCLSGLTDEQRNEMNRFWHRLEPAEVMMVAEDSEPLATIPGA